MRNKTTAEIVREVRKTNKALAIDRKKTMMVKYPVGTRFRVVTGEGDPLSGIFYNQVYTVSGYNTHGRQCYVMVKEQHNLGFVDSQMGAI